MTKIQDLEKRVEILTKQQELLLLRLDKLITLVETQTRFPSCPSCGSEMNLDSGNHWVCSKCGESVLLL